MPRTTNSATDLGVYAFIVAGILVMTRPGSQGPGLVKNFFSGFTRLVQGASGQHVSA